MDTLGLILLDLVNLAGLKNKLIVVNLNFNIDTDGHEQKKEIFQSDFGKNMGFGWYPKDDGITLVWWYWWKIQF